MDEEEFDLEGSQRRGFGHGVLNSRGWFQAALEVIEAAELIQPRVKEHWRELREWSEKKGNPPARYGCHWPYLMLMGYAIESFCKGLLVGRLGHDDRMRVLKSGRLPSEFKTHALYDLVIRIGMSVEPHEEDLLRRMTSAIQWQAKYPVSTSWDRGYFGYEHSDGNMYNPRVKIVNDADAASDLVDRVRVSVGAPRTYFLAK